MEAVISKKNYLDVSRTDYQLVSSALLNKGMAFTKEERDAFDLHGLIPPKIGTLSEQRKRVYSAFKSKSSDLERYIYLRDLQDSNETLFFSFITEHLDEALPIIYTPTVGLGCQKFSYIYRRPRGLFISYPLRHHIDQMLSNRRFKDVEIMVVSDGERILGLGDQGAGGMGIPIGKLALYSACAGIHPRRTLPIMLDVGTDNPALINDPIYVGWQNERIRGDKYYEFVDLFVKAVKKRFPHMLIQWEDFAKNNATAILERYQDEICTFNDDVQGTASVVLATLLAAIKCSKVPLEEHRIVIAGAGSAGCGIGRLILDIMKKNKIDLEQSMDKFYYFDQHGLLTDETPNVLPFQSQFCRSKQSIKNWKVKDKNNISLLEVVENVKPTVLIGVTAQAGLFSKEIIETMAKNVDRPIIFPLSNPNTCAEASPENIMKWTNEKALMGTGSPFSPVLKKGRPFRVDQTNNSYIFPGLGLGVISVQAERVTNSMFLRAAEKLASMSPAIKDPDANLLPPIIDSHKIAFKIAIAVAKEAIKCKVAKEISEKEIKEKIKHKMWNPVYRPYRRKTN
ncbi:MAG: NAD-dependent malic enzyme [Chlamydiae bacterium]|nr:NAD-dependent malic enzyme [Chlamydiota bacterium]